MEETKRSQAPLPRRDRGRIQTKRVYLTADAADGYRILVDRLWPRGIKKENARVDLWARDVAPSAELRKWFGHVPERFDEFARRYRKELEGSEAFASLVKATQEHDVVTLLFGARDEAHNNAVVLQSLIASLSGQE